jgi:murein DD-endopeptidase MepM/ murein hydrolase activator NlpD
MTEMAIARRLGSMLLAGSLLGASPAAAFQARLAAGTLRQGEVGVVLVTGLGQAREITGSVGSRPSGFFPYGDGYAAIVGIDLETPPGTLTWRVAAVDERGVARKASGTVTVKARQFPVQRLTLPPAQVDLDPETERRAESEAAHLRGVFESVSGERLWRGAFVRPVPGSGPGEGFGARRLINGKPRMPHAGIDFAADRGAPVVAVNRGRVALVAEFFFPGRLVILDHGLGLFTLYYHLDRVDVAEGALVERGESIGAVGATGRATGPHLHFGAMLRQARVDPGALLTLPLRD